MPKGASSSPGKKDRAFLLLVLRGVGLPPWRTLLPVLASSSFASSSLHRVRGDDPTPLASLVLLANRRSASRRTAWVVGAAHRHGTTPHQSYQHHHHGGLHMGRRLVGGREGGKCTYSSTTPKKGRGIQELKLPVSSAALTVHCRRGRVCTPCDRIMAGMSSLRSLSGARSRGLHLAKRGFTPSHLL